MSTVIIIAGGSSVKAVDLNLVINRGHVIGVNEAAVLIPCNEGVTMDRLWLENRYKQVPSWMSLWFREGTAKCFSPPDNFVPFRNDHTSNVMSDEDGVLNGTNSGMCAINLAYQMQPRRVFLFGFDMGRGTGGSAYWHPVYPWANPKGGTKERRYEKWATEFDAIEKQFSAKNIPVFNVSLASRILAFPRIGFSEFMRLSRD